MADVAVSNAGTGGTTVVPDTTSTGGPSGVQSAGQTTAVPVVVPANSAPDWTSSLSPEMKAYVTNKGFKDTNAVLDSYQNYEKLMGVPKEQLLKLPKEAADPAWNDVYDRLGRPKQASEYQFAKPAQGEQSPEFVDWAQKQFHGLGLTKTQGEKLAAGWNEYAQGLMQKDTEAYQVSVKNEDLALKKEWGAKYDENMRTGAKAMKEFGLDPEKDIPALEKAFGYGKTLKFLVSIGSKVGEAQFVDGDTNRGFQGAMTPDEARAQINLLKQDKAFVTKFLAKDVDAVQKMERLHQYLVSGQN